jgi:hypothetical protein
MKTTHEYRENESRKRLFRMLFEIQYELERNAGVSDVNVRLAIEMIDQVLENILHSVDD